MVGGWTNDVRRGVSDVHVLHFFIFAIFLVSSPRKICPVVLRKQMQGEMNIVCVHRFWLQCARNNHGVLRHTHLHTNTFDTTMLQPSTCQVQAIV